MNPKDFMKTYNRVFDSNWIEQSCHRDEDALIELAPISESMNDSTTWRQININVKGLCQRGRRWSCTFRC